MKSTRFWVGRFFLVVAITFVILLAASLLRGRAVDKALTESLTWAMIASAIFTGSRYTRAKKGIACALCKDTVED
ncbi:MAG: hypothetical protein V4693_17800 [Pseudomonadota bacterium]